MHDEWITYIPQQWVGIVALLMFGLTLITQFVEKYPAFAKLMPLGTWWHERAKKRRRRTDWIAEDNAVIAELQTQMAGVVTDMRAVQDSLRCFRAWSVYDARWHHRDQIRASEQGREPPRHYDFFEFEAIWNTNPAAAAQLSLMIDGGPGDSL